MRENPNRKGFLVVGTDNGPALLGRTRAATWKKLTGELPAHAGLGPEVRQGLRTTSSSARTAAACTSSTTSRRSRSSSASIESKALHVFTVQPAATWQIWNRGGFSVGAWTAPNPPNGVAIDYCLKSEIKQTEEQKKAAPRAREDHGDRRGGQPGRDRVRPGQGGDQPARLAGALRGAQTHHVRPRGAALRVLRPEPRAGRPAGEVQDHGRGGRRDASRARSRSAPTRASRSIRRARRRARSSRSRAATPPPRSTRCSTASTAGRRS